MVHFHRPLDIPPEFWSCSPSYRIRRRRIARIFVSLCRTCTLESELDIQSCRASMCEANRKYFLQFVCILNYMPFPNDSISLRYSPSVAVSSDRMNPTETIRIHATTIDNFILNLLFGARDNFVKLKRTQHWFGIYTFRQFQIISDAVNYIWTIALIAHTKRVVWMGEMNTNSNRSTHNGNGVANVTDLCPCWRWRTQT